jgi:zinc transport system substrate-binding protein
MSLCENILCCDVAIVHKHLINTLLILTLFNLVSCQVEQNSTISPNEIPNNNQSAIQETANKLQVTVSILPQKYFVEKIGGELVAVNVMVQPGVEPETYEPLPEQLVKLNNSSAYVSIGVPFEEAWLKKISSANPNIVLINSETGIEKISMVGHDHHEERHPEEHSETESLDPHIWLSPKLAKIQAENIYQGLVQIDPKNQAIYQENLTKLLTEIEEVDRQIAAKLSELSQRKFIVHHSAWGYLAAEYNLTQIPLEFEGQEVTSAQLVDLIQEAKSDKIKFVFAQPQFNNQTVEIFAREIGAEVVVIDHLAENWSENLLNAVDKLARSMK